MKKNIHLTLITLLFLFMVACNVQDEIITPTAHPTMNRTPNSCPEILPTPMPKPQFLELIYPSGSITKEEYEKSLTSPIFNGIHITVSANGIDGSILESADAEYRLTAISNRIQLLVDEIAISNDESNILDGLVDSGPFYFGWPVNLSIGIHKAKLIFNIDTGETVKYEWAFCILP